MDYIREINAFYDNDMINHLNQSAGHLYLVLLNIANRLFWKEGFMVSDALLMARAGIKDRRTFRRAMDELVKAGLIESTQTAQGTAYTIKGLCCRAAKNGVKNATSNAANDVNQEINPATDAALIAKNNVDFAKSTATDVTFNAHSNIDPATDAALNAVNNADFAINAATDATFNVRKNDVFTKNAASNVAFIARYDRDKPSNSEGSGSAQTKLNKLNEKEKETKQTAAAVLDEGSVNNKELIAELVAAYRETSGIENSKGDYPFIGALYNEYGYDQVLYGIHELSMAAATTRIEKPLIYLRAILIRAGPGRISYQKENNQIREEDPSAKYERERYRG